MKIMKLFLAKTLSELKKNIANIEIFMGKTPAKFIKNNENNGHFMGKIGKTKIQVVQEIKFLSVSQKYSYKGPVEPNILGISKTFLLINCEMI